MHAATGGSCRDHGGSVVQLVNVQSSQSERPRRYGDLQQPLDSAGIGLQYGGVVVFAELLWARRDGDCAHKSKNGCGVVEGRTS